MKLELKGITKKFGSVIANEDINLVVEPGEIHALLGENGAGKSTLMNVLYGIHQPDAGEILIDGQVVKFTNPGDAVAAKIGMVHQHFMLVPVFTVAESVALGYEPTKKLGIIDIKTAKAKVLELSQRFNFNIDPDAYIEDLPVGVQQRVEIIKALARDASILILDEPTAVLTPQETDELIKIMRQLSAAGTSIVFITHKLREVRAVADKITVIRAGKVIGEASPQATETELASAMVGRSVELKIQKQPTKATQVAFSMDKLTLLDFEGRTILDNLSFEVKNGEVLVVAGVQGNGQTELAQVILGLSKPTSGKMILGKQDITNYSVKQKIKAGIGFIPEDRLKDGVVKDFSIAENLVLNRLAETQFVKFGTLNIKNIYQNAQKCQQDFDIRLGSVHDPISTLSGGNQQKVVVARELSHQLKMLLASQPTRGVDVGSIEFIHSRIIAERDLGIPVIIVSTELDEVYALADRIMVMYRGKILAIVPVTTPRKVLGLMIAGFSLEEAEKRYQTDINKQAETVDE